MSEKKRRIMRSFTINEICLVGDSTQGGLRVPIMQRAEPLGRIGTPPARAETVGNAG